MRIYNTVEETISEWSNILKLRKYTTIKETLDMWSKSLTDRYKKPFIIRDNAQDTLKEWSKLLWKGV